MQTTINAPKGVKTYRAGSLEDLAQFFSTLADNEHNLMIGALRQKTAVQHRGARNAYRDVANILRNTEFEVSWLAQELDAQGGPQESTQRNEMLTELMKHFSMRDLDIMKEQLP